MNAKQMALDALIDVRDGCEEPHKTRAAIAALEADIVQPVKPVNSLPAELRWRLTDIREMLLSRGGNGERLYGIDEWSTPAVNLKLAINLINAAPQAATINLELLEALPVVAYRITSEVGDSWVQKHPGPNNYNREPLVLLFDVRAAIANTTGSKP